MTTIMGVDQSFSNTGVVICRDSSLIHHEVISTKSEKNPISRATAAKTIAVRLMQIIIDHKVDVFVIEGLGFGAFGDATRDLAGLQFIILADILDEFEDLGLTSIEIVPPNTLKKFATGSGKADKKSMFSALPEPIRSVFSPITIKAGKYDLADAFWLSKIGETYGNQQSGTETTD